MILIEEEPQALFDEFKVYEKCTFCSTPTNTWNEEFNRPVCFDCSEEKDNEQLIEIVNREKFMRDNGLDENDMINDNGLTPNFDKIP